MAWLAVLGTLLGALVGAGSALATQQMAARFQRRADLRLERKKQIDAFLKAAQKAERIAEDRDKCDHSTKAQTADNLWLHHKRLALICLPDLVAPLNDLANALANAIWKGPPEGVPVWEHVAGQTGRFLDAAGHEIAWTSRRR